MLGFRNFLRAHPIVTGAFIACLLVSSAFALGPRPETSSPSMVLASDNKGTPGVPPSKGIISVQGAKRSDPYTAPVDVSLDQHGVCTYRYSASFTPQATGAVTLVTYTGSATKTIRIKRVWLTGHSTANAQEIIALQRTSALGAGGTAVPVTAGQLDTKGLASATCGAATGAVNHYTTTLKAAGTPSGGALSTQDFWTGVVTTPTVAIDGLMVFPEGGAPAGQSIVLRGASDFLELQSVNAGNLSAGTVLQYTIEAEEE
jgi:hypothetical protein